MKIIGVSLIRTVFVLSFYHCVKYLASNSNYGDRHKNARRVSYNMYFIAVHDCDSTIYSKTHNVKFKVIR